MKENLNIFKRKNIMKKLILESELKNEFIILLVIRVFVLIAYAFYNI